MRFSVSFVCAVAGASILAGCAGGIGEMQNSAGGNVREQASPREACVGVVSDIGHPFIIKTIGFTVFGNDEQLASIESWRIDDLVVSRVAAHLGPRVAIRRVTHPKGAFAPEGYLQSGNTRAALQKYAAATRCSRFVVVRRHYAPHGTTNQTLYGLGVVKGALPMPTFPLHAILVVGVYDGRTFANLRQTQSTIGKLSIWSPFFAPHVQVDSSAWPLAPEVVANNPKLREATRELVIKSMDMTLPLLNVREGEPGGT